MKSARFHTRYIVVALLALLGAGCTKDSTTNPLPPDEPEGASVSGFVYQISGAERGAVAAAAHAAPQFGGAEIRVYDAPGSAPAGAAPLAGALLSVLDLSGRAVGSAAADGSGAFRIEGLPAGLLTLEIRTGGAGSAADASFEFTAVAEATVPLGRAFPIGREAAIGLATTGVSADALVLGTLQPLPAGTRVRPSRDADGSPRARTLSADAWLFFVNPEPFARFDHACEYVFVDAASGAVSRASGVLSPPAINGADSWSADLEFVRYTGIDFDAFDPENIPPAAAASLTAEVVQAPAGLGTAAPLRPLASSPRRGAAGLLSPARSSEAPEDVFTLAIQGMAGSDLAADFQNMSKLFEQIAPVASHRETMVFPQHTLEASGTEYRTRFNRLRDGIEARLRAGGKPLLVVFITSHGALDFETGEPLDTYVQDHSNGQKIDAGPASHLLTTARPCKLVVILDFCYALRFADALYDIYEALPEDQRPELEIYAGCGGRETSKSFTYWQSWVPGTGDPGGVFTNAVRGRITVTPSGGFMGLLGQDGELLPELRTLTSNGGTQSPHVRKLPGRPAWCGELLTASATTLSFAYDSAADPLPFTIGTITLTNGSTLPVTWSFSSGHFSIEANPSSGTIPPNGTVQVTVLYTGGAQSPFSTSIVFTAEESGGSRTTNVSIPLAAEIKDGVEEKEFEVSAPLGPLAGRLYELFLGVPQDATVDSTKLIDLTTGQPPALEVWPAAPFVKYYLTYEGRNQAGNYGIRFKFENNTLESCPFEVCGLRRWRYTIWYSRP